MKQPVPDLKWLPSAVDWDFRSVTEAECRVACHWEHAREIHQLTEGVIRGASGTIGAKEGQVSAGVGIKSALFPRAWCSLAAEERVRLVDTYSPAPALQVRPLANVLERAQPAERAGAQSPRHLHRGAYVIRPNFSGAGVEAVIKQFELWARMEAKKHTRSPRAKAAAPPFDLLKWLAVGRVDAARVAAKLTYEVARVALMEYRRANPRLDPNGVFPIYASHGAWSKARRDAERFRIRFLSNGSIILSGRY